MYWKACPVDHWLPARSHPETYPGDCPSSSYLLLGDYVYPVIFNKGEPEIVTVDGSVESLDELLERAGLPPVTERIAVLAYGGNRNPATLRIKFSNYRYKTPGSATAIPVLRGVIDGADVAACRLSGQGYLYGDLLIEQAVVSKTTCDVWVALADHDQLRVLNDSEIGTGDYVAARFQGVRVGRPLEHVLGYAACKPCFVAPDLGLPLAFRSVEAHDRSLPEMTPLEMLRHAVDVLDIGDRVQKLSEGATFSDDPLTLANYLNRNWWRAFSGQQPEPGYKRIMCLFDEALSPYCLARSTASLLGEREQLLTEDEAYHPDLSLLWEGL